MSTRSYERLPIEVFGRELITSGDLDPVYIALHNMRDEMSPAQRNRWLLAYWCFYHTGVASYMSEFEGLAFWRWMHTAADNQIGPLQMGIGGTERWPRGGERRHFRGEQAKKAVSELMDRYGDKPEDMVSMVAQPKLGMLKNGTPLPFYMVNERAQEHRGFGDWISFKIGDMIDRLDIYPVGFDEATVFMYKDPLKSALMLWRQKQGLPENAVPKDQSAAVSSVVEYLTEEFKDLQAPPLGDRPVGLQEVETVLCKWKSHLNGHYPLMNDTHEILEGLKAWDDCTTARMFALAMPGEK